MPNRKSFLAIDVDLPFFACNISAGSGGRDEQWLGLKLDCIDENGLPALDGYLRQRLLSTRCQGTTALKRADISDPPPERSVIPLGAHDGHHHHHNRTISSCLSAADAKETSPALTPRLVANIYRCPKHPAFTYLRRFKCLPSAN
ncbi:hypothetical protein DBV15_08298 [Temnothorax longispinosus]|uniref:Uncharacterized protein n=1 Tax=Temnothorax longispinosus TaxID=300112 RepID=A0A4S2KLL0_9HYME|nr:hypothetical protein DBV15_08298 [Temnothorax longispinosus]